MTDAKSVGPQADVYGIAMTAAFCIYGQRLSPHDAFRPNEFLGKLRLRRRTRAALSWGLKLKPEQRAPSVAAWCTHFQQALNKDRTQSSATVVDGALKMAASTDPVVMVTVMTGAVPAACVLGLIAYLFLNLVSYTSWDPSETDYWIAIGITLVLPYWAYTEWSERGARRERDAHLRSGRNQPVMIQPIVNVRDCVGCGICQVACPEEVFAIIDGQAVTSNTAACIGHGMCVDQCPVDAVELVFGSEKRYVAIPEVGGNFQTNVPGLYIAGELGGMGLVANAANQGRQSDGQPFGWDATRGPCGGGWGRALPE